MSRGKGYTRVTLLYRHCISLGLSFNSILVAKSVLPFIRLIHKANKVYKKSGVWSNPLQPWHWPNGKSLPGGFTFLIGEDSICSHVYVERLLDFGANISMSTRGQPNENAFAESFFKTVRWEEVYLHHYRICEEAQANLQTFLEDVYNTKWFHLSLDHVPPDEFELKNAGCSCLGGLDFLGALHNLLSISLSTGAAGHVSRGSTWVRSGWRGMFEGEGRKITTFSVVLINNPNVKSDQRDGLSQFWVRSKKNETL